MPSACATRSFPAFGLSCIGCVEDYHAQFTFPVRTYYERAGVTDENFDAVVHAWMDEYVRGCAEIPLHGDALETLERFQRAGLTQVILSASKLEVLRRQLSYYPLDGYFDRVLGLSDILRAQQGENRPRVSGRVRRCAGGYRDDWRYAA